MTPSSSATRPIYSSLADDPDLSEIVEMFVAELPERVATILYCLEHQQWESLRRAAHQLKGAGGSYGFAPITSSAARLEQLAASAASEEQIRRAVDELADICHRAQGGRPL
jgi:HPt (histidine-containing phosphotransfer) domain-containing protein